MIASNLLVPVTHQPGEDALFHYTQTASALGLDQGVWPLELMFDGDVPMMHCYAPLKDGDTNTGWIYRSVGHVYRIDIENC